MSFLSLFKKSKEVSIDRELVSTVGLTNFYYLDGTTWNPDNIKLDTYKKISKHYQVAAAMAVISYSIQQIDWFIQAEDEKVKKVLTISIENIWNRLIRSASKSFIYGFSPNVKVFKLEKIEGKEYIVYKKIKDLDPADCVVKTDKYGVFNGFIYKKGSLQEVTVKPDYAFWYVANMENGNLYGESMLKKIYKPWWFSEKVHTFANRYYERFGEPLVLGRAPSGAKVKNASGATKDAQDLMKEIIENIRNHSSVQLPSDKDTETKEYLYDLKYIESQMRGFDFGTYLDRLDFEMTKGLLLPELTLGGQKGGSYALGSAQIDVFYTNLMGLMDNIVDYVNLYLLPQILQYNFGEDVKARLAYQPLSIETRKFINTLITEMVKASRLKPDIAQLEERSGVKLKEIEPPAPKPMTAPTGSKNKEKALKKELSKEIDQKLDIINKQNLLEFEKKQVEFLKEELLKEYD